MTELLDRCNQQAVRIAELEKECATLRHLNQTMPAAIRANLLDSMRRAAVNCGAHSGCALAKRMP